MGALVKNQAENGISKLFDLRVQTIDVSNQDVFTLNYLGLNDGEGKKTNVSDPLTVGQRRSGIFSFMITVYPD